jgi:hypothetical protein
VEVIDMMGGPRGHHHPDITMTRRITTQLTHPISVDIKVKKNQRHYSSPSPPTAPHLVGGMHRGQQNIGPQVGQAHLDSLLLAHYGEGRVVSSKEKHL